MSHQISTLALFLGGASIIITTFASTTRPSIQCGCFCRSLMFLLGIIKHCVVSHWHFTLGFPCLGFYLISVFFSLRRVCMKDLCVSSFCKKGISGSRREGAKKMIKRRKNQYKCTFVSKCLCHLPTMCKIEVY